MFCENCGKEIPDDATFCPNCGGKNAKRVVKKVAGEKNMILALIISFFLTGLGIFYSGNKKKGIIFFVVCLIFYILGRAIPICAVIAVIIWAYALYDTYNEVKIANGESKPNLMNDFKTWTMPKKIGAVIVVLFILLLVMGTVISAFGSNTDTTYDDSDSSLSSDDLEDSSSSSDYDSSSDDYDSSSSGSSSSDSSSGSSSSSSGGDSYSSTSDGKNTYSHYEGEHGSSDTYGTVNDDGSVDAYQTGHTDYGDYKIDSHMDSDGNIHGTVDVGGKTYHVSS